MGKVVHWMGKVGELVTWSGQRGPREEVDGESYYALPITVRPRNALLVINGVIYVRDHDYLVVEPGGRAVEGNVLWRWDGWDGAFVPGDSDQIVDVAIPRTP